MVLLQSSLRRMRSQLHHVRSVARNFAPLQVCWVGHKQQPSSRSKKKRKDQDVKKSKETLTLSTAPSSSPHETLIASLSDTAADASLSPTAADYRALIVDLLLYRQETLLPVVEALAREREAMEVKLEEMQIAVTRLERVRDEIRSLLVNYRMEDKKKHQDLLDALFKAGALQKDPSSKHDD